MVHSQSMCLDFTAVYAPLMDGSALLRGYMILLCCHIQDFEDGEISKGNISIKYMHRHIYIHIQNSPYPLHSPKLSLPSSLVDNPSFHNSFSHIKD